MRRPQAVFPRLAGSGFRRRFRLGPKEQAYLEGRGIETVMEHGRDFVARRLAPAAPPNDGKQTPMRGHPIFVAQHATATCCRGCLAKWWGVETGRPLTDDEQAVVLAALRGWLESQVRPV